MCANTGWSFISSPSLTSSEDDDAADVGRLDADVGGATEDDPEPEHMSFVREAVSSWEMPALALGGGTVLSSSSLIDLGESVVCR